MGGFYYLNGDDTQEPKLTQPIAREDLKELIDTKQLRLPSKQEINDKSKGDPFSKAFAIFQTLWFVIQCSARRLQHLPITNLELVTLAYAAITIAMYRFWWSKPLHVLQPTPVPGRPPWRPTPNPALSVHPTGSSPSSHEMGSVPSSHKTRSLDYMKTFMYAVIGVQDDDVDLRQIGLTQVPTFYAGKPDEHLILLADFIALLVALVFGAIHCIAWSFTFPSHIELLLWRISSVTIIVVPFIFILLVAIFTFRVDLLSKIAIFGAIIGIPFYIIARIVLIILAFTTLRSLPSTTYETVQWLTFFPHV